jgi:hypothetical protein
VGRKDLLFSSRQGRGYLHLHSLPSTGRQERFPIITRPYGVDGCCRVRKMVKARVCYFAGDTGYNYEDFRSIGHYFPQIDLSLVPIGAHKPKIFQQPHHLSPEEAVLVHNEIKSKLTVAMH